MASVGKRWAGIGCAAAIAWMAACQTVAHSDDPLTASLKTDSAQVSVHRSGVSYIADIGYTYTNTTPGPVAKRGCGITPPDLEKKVNGRWVAAYNPVRLMCIRVPDFSLASGQSYHGVLHFMAAEPGHNVSPTLSVDSIDGTYRLRWDFVEGTDAGVEGAKTVSSTSNEFRMVLT
jgi:hypothetical protein